MGKDRDRKMRQFLIILTIVFFCNNLFAQVDECQSGTDSAKVDFSNGILRIYIFGLSNSFTYGKLLKDQYGIDVIYGGDIVDERWNCYSIFMNEKIKEKFGNDIFDKVAKKSQQLDSAGKGDRQSEFPGGQMELMKFVYCNLDLTKVNYSKNETGKVYLQFEIDTIGLPINIKVMKSPNLDYSEEAIRIINLMPNWITATHNGKPIKEKWNLPIVFDNEWIEKYCP
jgi:hypothetical protein